MADQYVEYEETGCLDQLKEALAGLLVAPIIILIAIGVLFWNEGRAVQRARDLESGKNKVVSVSADEVQSKYDGKLVHTTGELSVDSPLTDEMFGVTAESVKLRRAVEMYQWVEDEETEEVRRDGREVEKTTYTYHKKWREGVVDSARFKHSKGHQNPSTKPFDSRSFRAETVTLGAFEVGGELIAKLPEGEPLTLESSVKEQLPEDYRNSANVRGNIIYLDGSSRSPSVGDLRVRFTHLPTQTVSVAAAQTDGVLTPYTSPDLNDELGLIQTGSHSANKLFADAQAANTTLTWILRGAGWVALIIAFSMFFGPLEALAGSLPLVGWIAEDVVEFGALLFSLVISTALALGVIAVGWIFYRPLVGIGLLVAGGLLAGGLFYFGRKRRKAAS